MKTTIGIILLIVGLAVGGVGVYFMNSGQISSFQSQVSNLQAQITTLQGDVSGLQDQLSSANSQVVYLNGKLQALQVPLVIILSYPSTVSVGEHFTLTANVTGGIPGKIEHFGIHRGMSEADIVAYSQSTGDTPQVFQEVVPAPNQTGPFAIRAHALIDGQEVWSDEKTIMVESAATYELRISTGKVIINKQETISQGVPLTVTVKSVAGFNSPVALSVANVPGDSLTTTLNPTTVTPPANGEVESTLSVAVITGATGGQFGTRPTFGTFTLHVIGTSGSTTQSDSVTVVVTNPLNSFVVSIIGFSFKPSTITVPLGGTVVWTNLDPVTHTITSSRWDSGDLAMDQSYAFTFNTAGTFVYHDKYNPDVTGTVIVTPY